jgi:hypothetical protein
MRGHHKYAGKMWDGAEVHAQCWLAAKDNWQSYLMRTSAEVIWILCLGNRIVLIIFFSPPGMWSKACCLCQACEHFAALFFVQSLTGFALCADYLCSVLLFPLCFLLIVVYCFHLHVIYLHLFTLFLLCIVLA